jgi:hypothetical protein
MPKLLLLKLIVMLNVRFLSNFFFCSYINQYYILAAIAAKYHINKYPSLKLFRFGVAIKREYRGARSADSFIAYLNEQLVDPITHLKNIYQINEVDVSFKIPFVCYSVLKFLFKVC